MNGKSTRSIAANFGWLVSGKLVDILNSVVVGALVARHLGPTKFGYIAYAMSIIALCTPMLSLGFGRVLIRKWVQEPETKGEIFWTALASRSLTALAIYAVVNTSLFIGIIEIRDQQELSVVYVTLLVLLVAPLDIAKLVLEANVQSRIEVWNRYFWQALASAGKIGLIFSLKDVEDFATLQAATTCLGAITLGFIVWRSGMIPAFKMPTLATFRELIVECWPLIIAGTSIAIYMNLDIAMLSHWSGSQVAGEYAVAVRLTTALYFLPVTLASSLLPRLAKLHVEDQQTYKSRLAEYFELNTAMAYVCLSSGLLLMPYIIQFLFGDEYSASIKIFQVHAFSLPFVFLGVARSQHLVLEKLHTISLLSTVLGASINVAMNCWLIPIAHANGAAIATVVSYAVSAYLSSFMFARTKWLGLLQSRAMIWPFGCVKLMKNLPFKP